MKWYVCQYLISKKNSKNINIIYFMNKIIARALSRTRRHAPTHAQVCTHIRALAPAHACLHTHANTHTHTPIHARTSACKPPHTPIHTRTRQRAFAHTYTYTCICMNLHVRTHVLDFSSLDTWMGYMTEKHLSLARVFC